MRHRKDTFKLSRTPGHQRALIANMLKSLIMHERIETTLAKAKILRQHADKMVTLAKKGTLASRREAISHMQIRFNQLDSKEKRLAKEGDLSGYNEDRKVVKKLFETLGPRFTMRQGGYTRLIKGHTRVGDGAEVCIIEYLSE